jgi:uncharacterized protein (DUF58 family)
VPLLLTRRRDPDPGARTVLAVTKAALLPVVAACLLTGLAALTDDVWLFLLASATLGTLAAALLMPPRLHGLTYRLDAPARTAVGFTSVHRVTVHNGGRRTAPTLRLTHHAAGFDDVTVAVAPLPPGATATVELPRAARRRAHGDEHRFVVTSTAPLGLLRATQTVEARQLLVVHPAPVPVRALPPYAGTSTDGDATTSRQGLDPAGIRDWRPGDPTRHVHWRSTARRGRPVVVEREEHRAARLALVVTGPAAAPDWERLVAAVAATAVGAHGHGRPVALLAGQPGLDGWCTGPATALLDWCSALVDPPPPDAATLREAVRWAGPDGEVLLAAPADWRSEWWAAAQWLTTEAGGRLAVFRP